VKPAAAVAEYRAARGVREQFTEWIDTILQRHLAFDFRGSAASKIFSRRMNMRSGFSSCTPRNGGDAPRIITAHAGR
jgi:hypothetical protein